MDSPINQSLSSSPVRLILLLQDLKFGGTQRQTLELASRLDPRRFQVEIWLMAGGEDLVPLARERGLPLVRLARQRLVGPAALANLWRRLKRHPVDVLMPLTVVPNIWGRILGRLAGVPVIVGNCRGGAAPRRQHERWLWPLADQIICNAAALKEELANHYAIPPHRLTVIPNGVDLEFFLPPASPPGSGPPVVLSVARLVPDKDHDTLIRSFRRVAEDHPQAELWLVGEGPRQGAIQRLIQDCRLTHRVRFFPGQVDLRPFFQRASLFTLSSVTEAMPNVVLEAMAAGLPVVATRVGGLPEVVTDGKTGYLVPPKDVSALAAALSQLLADEEARQALGQAGRERVKRDFSLTSMIQRHEQVLENLLVRTRRLSPTLGLGS